MEYISIMKTNTNWYWKQLENKESVIIATCTIFHTCLYVPTIKYVSDISRSLYNKKQARKDVQGYPIFISDADHDYNCDEIERRDKIDYKRYLHNVE